MQTISQTEFLLIEGRKVKKQLTAKIICIGDSFVGKTSIVCRYIQNHFKTDCQSTIGFFY